MFVSILLYFNSHIMISLPVFLVFVMNYIPSPQTVSCNHQSFQEVINLACNTIAILSIKYIKFVVESCYIM